MDPQLEQKVVRIIARHDQMLRRAVRMLAANARGDKLARDAEFSMDELRSLDSNSSDLAIELVGDLPDRADWTPPTSYAYKDYGSSSSGPMTWLNNFEQGVRLSKRYFESFLPLSSRNIHMGDNINVGAAHVVMGSGARSGNITTHGSLNLNDLAAPDLHAIADELAVLRKSMRRENPDDDLERDSDIGAVASAEKAARAGDKDKMIADLKAVGAWGADIATKIGVSLASAALKSAAGLGS